MSKAFDVTPDLASPPTSRTRGRARLSSAGPRVARLVLMAVLLYGGWAAFANHAHGAAAALRAGLTQGVSSGITTLLIGAIIEALHAALPPRRRALVATLVAASHTALLHVALHLAAGTPEILRTVLPSVVLGYAFAGAYAGSLSGRSLRLDYRRPSTLSAAERDAVWSLLSRSVQRDRGAFEDKLARTQEVFLGHDERGMLVAFGAVDVVEAEREGRAETVLYTHWAVIHPRLRGANILQRVGLRCFLRARLRHPLRPIHWLFSASTFTSYALLARNYETYWPRPGITTPAGVRAMLDGVMRRLEGASWDPEAGVLRRHGASRYREGVVEDDPSILQHPVLGPAVRFYAERNPDQRDGDSLVCLCPLTAANWWVCLRAAFARSRRRKPSA